MRPTITRQTVALDFDGVLNLYTGWNGGAMPPPRPGVTWFLQQLARDFDLVIFTCRDAAAVRAYVTAQGWDPYIREVTNTKPHALCYLDDRGVRFQGDFEQALLQIRGFTPFWREGRA